MDPLTVAVLVAGLVMLFTGAEALVRGASRLAAALGLSPLVIGLTVVAYGTSAPELAVSVQSALAAQPDVAVGNVVGSNIFNVLFILGASALIVPLAVSQRLVRLDVPIMIGVSLLALALALDGRVSRWDGLLLAAGAVAYTVLAVRLGRREPPEVEDEYAREFGRGKASGARQVATQIALIVGGLGLLVIGARWLVESAVVLARALGVSELIIGLTLVAAGTSLPEVATSIVAAVRGERDIAVGNVVGSNIFNVLCVLGVAALAAPEGLPVSPALVRFDIPVMIAVAVACLPIFFTGHLIARWEGAVFLGYYVAYVLYLALNALRHDALPAFNAAMVIFVIPLTAITLAIGVARTVQANRRRLAA
jgi:cation:H+ antiporter